MRKMSPRRRTTRLLIPNGSAAPAECVCAWPASHACRRPRPPPAGPRTCCARGLLRTHRTNVGGTRRRTAASPRASPRSVSTDGRSPLRAAGDALLRLRSPAVPPRDKSAGNCTIKTGHRVGPRLARLVGLAPALCPRHSGEVNTSEPAGMTAMGLEPFNNDHHVDESGPKPQI